MQYIVKTSYETLHSITYNYYHNLNMLNSVLLANANIKNTFLEIGTVINLPTQAPNTQERKKLY